jgi:hypothetical protein
MQDRRKTLVLEDSVIGKKLQLEGTTVERLHLETERARLAAEADTRAEAAKDADIKRHERRLQLEQQYAAPLPPLATAAPRAPTAEAKTIRQLAEGESYWGALSRGEREFLLTAAGRAAVSDKEGLAPLVDRVQEKTPDGNTWEVNAYPPAYHVAICNLLLRTVNKTYKKTQKGSPKQRPAQRSIHAFYRRVSK